MISERIAAGSAVASAIAASLCCIGPLVAVGLGFGAFGAAIEPLRSYLLAASAVALGFGFHRAYLAARPACAPDGMCRSARASQTSRIILWAAALAALALGVASYVTSPLAAAFFEAKPLNAYGVAQESSAATLAKATLDVKGMTCAGCETTVRRALERTPGVASAFVSYERGEAVISYDPARTNPADIARTMTRETGYAATPREPG